MKKKVSVVGCAIAAVLLCASCTSLPPKDPDEVIKDEQTRFKEQSLHYPDRDSPQQQKEAAEQARKDDMLKK
jgi:hypothetical protein